MIKRLKLCIICVGILFMITLVCSSVSASNINNPTYKIDTKSMTITGKLSNASRYANVTLEVFYPDKSLEDIKSYTKADILSALLVYKQTNADEEGNYSFKVDMSGCDTAVYMIRISSDDVIEPYEEEVAYATAEYKKQFIINVNNAVSPSELQSVLNISSEKSLNAKMMQLTNPLIFSVDSKALAEIFFGLNENEKTDPDKPEQFIGKINLAAVLQGLNEGKAFNILDYKDELNLDNDFVKTYNDKVISNEKKNFTVSFAGNGLKNIEDVNASFGKNVILSIVNNIQNWADILYVIDHHSDFMGLDLTKYNAMSNKENLALVLAEGSPYTTIDNFKTSFNTATTSPVTPTTGNKHSSGVGSSVSFSGNVSMPSIPLDDIAKTGAAIEFDDLSSVQWAKSSIEALVQKGIVSGTGNKKFEPDRKILREEFVKMLVLAFNIETSEGTVDFVDIDSSAWYCKYITGAKKAGIIQGLEDESFGIGKPITREEMMTLAFRTANYKGLKLNEQSNEKFSDDDEISQFAQSAVYAMKDKKIIDGVGENKFAPKDACTRAQAAKVIYSLMKLGGENQ